MSERWWLSNFSRNEFMGGAELLGEQFSKAANLKYMCATKFGIKHTGDLYGTAKNIDERIKDIELDVLFYNSINCWSNRPNAKKRIAVCCENFRTEADCMKLDEQFYSEKNMQWDKQKLSLENADKIVVLSEFEFENFRSLGYDVIKIEPYVNLSAFEPGPSEIRQNLGIPKDKMLGLYIGRNHSRKGFDVMSDLLNRRKDVFFVCIGAGNLKSDNFIGFNNVSEGFLIDCYRGADFLIMPSRYESFGFVYAEAMACGTPILSSQTGIMADDDFWECGVTTTKVCYESFSDMIDFFKYARGKYDKARCREIAEKRFSFDRFRRDVNDLLSDW